MKRNHHPIGKCLTVLILLSLLTVPSMALAKNYRLTMQSAFPRGDVSVPLHQVDHAVFNAFS